MERFVLRYAGPRPESPWLPPLGFILSTEILRACSETIRYVALVLFDPTIDFGDTERILMSHPTAVVLPLKYPSSPRLVVWSFNVWR